MRRELSEVLRAYIPQVPEGTSPFPFLLQQWNCLIPFCVWNLAPWLVPCSLLWQLITQSWSLQAEQQQGSWARNKGDSWTEVSCSCSWVSQSFTLQVWTASVTVSVEWNTSSPLIQDSGGVPDFGLERLLSRRQMWRCDWLPRSSPSGGGKGSHRSYAASLIWPWEKGWCSPWH